MTQNLKIFELGDTDTGAVLAEYHLKPTTLLLFIAFFVGLFFLGMDVSILHQITGPDPELRFRIAGVADMIMSVVFILYLALRLLWKKAPIMATDKGILVQASELKKTYRFIPWDKLLALLPGMVRLNYFFKMKYLVLRVAPEFPIPKNKSAYLQLAPNEFSISLDWLAIKPEDLIRELVLYQSQFSGRTSK